MRETIETGLVGLILAGLIIYLAGTWFALMGDRPRTQVINGKRQVVRPTPIPVTRDALPPTQRVVFPRKVWDR